MNEKKCNFFCCRWKPDFINIFSGLGVFRPIAHSQLDVLSVVTFEEIGGKPRFFFHCGLAKWKQFCHKLVTLHSEWNAGKFDVQASITLLDISNVDYVEKRKREKKWHNQRRFL